MMLALLWLNMFDQGPGTRVWKRHNVRHMDRLYAKGLIDDPKGKTESVIVTEEGRMKAEELFRKHFALESSTD